MVEPHADQGARVCTCPPFVSAEPGDCAIHAPRTKDGTCDCGHPWFDHDAHGCHVDSFLTGACPCRLTGPPSAASDERQNDE